MKNKKTLLQNSIEKLQRGKINTITHIYKTAYTPGWVRQFYGPKPPLFVNLFYIKCRGISDQVVKSATSDHKPDTTDVSSRLFFCFCCNFPFLHTIQTLQFIYTTRHYTHYIGIFRFGLVQTSFTVYEEYLSQVRKPEFFIINFNNIRQLCLCISDTFISFFSMGKFFMENVSIWLYNLYYIYYCVFFIALTCKI